jgi:hypothetical protein
MYEVSKLMDQSVRNALPTLIAYSFSGTDVGSTSIPSGFFE